MRTSVVTGGALYSSCFMTWADFSEGNVSSLDRGTVIQAEACTDEFDSQRLVVFILPIAEPAR